MPLDLWPPLPLDDWEPTYLTLHRWTQIVGKIRLALAPPLPHWWHVTLQVSTRGLTTAPMAVGDRALTLSFDFCEHRFVAECSDGRNVSLPLRPMPVADFYRQVMDSLGELGISIAIHTRPVEVVDTTPFEEDRHHASYDPEAVERLHRVLLSVDHLFNTFRGRFLGKCSPVHFFWGAFDLAVTRFSGRPNPAPPSDAVMHEAYSHEVVSHGFWPGGDWPIGGRVGEAVFYAYAVPEPPGFRNAPVRAPASYSTELGEFLLPYEAVRTAGDPAATLLGFMEDSYQAAAEGMGIDVRALRHEAA